MKGEVQQRGGRCKMQWCVFEIKNHGINSFPGERERQEQTETYTERHTYRGTEIQRETEETETDRDTQIHTGRDTQRDTQREEVYNDNLCELMIGVVSIYSTLSRTTSFSM